MAMRTEMFTLLCVCGFCCGVIFRELDNADAQRIPPGLDTSTAGPLITGIIGALNVTLNTIEQPNQNEVDVYRVYLHNPAKLQILMEPGLGYFNPAIFLMFQPGARPIAFATASPVVGASPTSPPRTLIWPGLAAIDVNLAGLGGNMQPGTYSIAVSHTHTAARYSSSTELFRRIDEETRPGAGPNPAYANLPVTSFWMYHAAEAVYQANYQLHLVQAASCFQDVTGVRCKGHDASNYLFLGAAGSVYSMWSNKWMCINAKFQPSINYPANSVLSELYVQFSDGTPSIVVSVTDGSSLIAVTFGGVPVVAGAEPTFGPTASTMRAFTFTTTTGPCGYLKLRNSRTLYISLGNYSVLATASSFVNAIDVDIWVNNWPLFVNVADGFLGQTRDGGTLFTGPAQFLVASGNLEQCTSARFVPSATLNDWNNGGFYCPTRYYNK